LVAQAEEKIKKAESAINIVEDYIPPIGLALSKKDFLQLKNTIEVELADCYKSQEETLSKYVDLQSSKQHLLNQLKIAKAIEYELDEDYRFSVENTETDTIECPICATEHDNSITSRAFILKDKETAHFQVRDIESELNKVNQEITNCQFELNSIRSKVTEIHNKYNIKYDSKTSDLRELIDKIAFWSVKWTINNKVDFMYEEISELNDLHSKIKKEQQDLLPQSRKKELDKHFRKLLTHCFNLLGLDDRICEKIKTPTDYRHLKGLAAADSTRAMVAYYITIYHLIYKNEDIVNSPLIIDTPNQQEQSTDNYRKILDLIPKAIPNDCQTIICAMDDLALSPLKQIANIIELDDKRLLRPSKHETLNNEFIDITSSI
ncbi:hypothetical protein, partial [Zooshikella harenae]